MANKERIPNPDDVGTQDGIMKALYESLSYVTGSQPDFDRFKTLFRDEALLIPPKSDKASPLQQIDVDLWVKKTVEHIVLDGMERKGQHVAEIARRTSKFGSMVQIFSTFDSRMKASDAAPSQRGIYSVQMMRDSQRWWIVSLMWDFERSDLPIPRAYLI